MVKYSTKELLDMFFAETSREGKSNNRAILDRDELYAYENSISRELIEMNAQEIVGLVNAIYCTTKDGKGMVYSGNKFSTYEKLVSLINRFFDWYNKKAQTLGVTLVYNPCNDDMLKGKGFRAAMSKDKDVLTFEVVQKAINIARENDKEKADYYELIILLFYNGFENPEEVVAMQENMIDHDKHRVLLPGRTVQVSDRCYELLVKIHNMSVMQSSVYNKTFEMVSWHDSYMKFSVLSSKVDEFQDKDIKRVQGKITRLLTKEFFDLCSLKLDYTTLYRLGLYDFIVKQYGLIEANKMITAQYDIEGQEKIATAAKLYGRQIDNNTAINTLKKSLIPFVREA